jgi:hypothetical protein
MLFHSVTFTLDCTSLSKGQKKELETHFRRFLKVICSDVPGLELAAAGFHVGLESKYAKDFGVVVVCKDDESLIGFRSHSQHDQMLLLLKPYWIDSAIATFSA